MRRLLPVALLALTLCACGSVGTVRVPPARQTFPAPPAGSVVIARQHGGEALGVALLPGAAQTTVQVSLVDASGHGVRAVPVELTLQSAAGRRSAAAATCGAGCYRATFAGVGRPVELIARIRGSVERFRLPSEWPPPHADRLLARATATWKALRTLVNHQHLASGPKTAIDTLWLSAAPDRTSYRIRGGATAVVIGKRRWDKVPRGRWQASSTTPQREPVPPWLEPTNVRLLGSAIVGGHRTWLLSFYDPQLHAWFSLWIERGTLRTLRLRMTATAHFMHDVYGPFNSPVKIEPPEEG